MTHDRYVLIETAIGVIINAVLSLAFVLLVFGGLARVPAFGSDGLIVDAIPQTLMVVLMSTLVPGLIGRARLASGKLVGPVAPPLSRLAVHAIVTAALAAAALTALQAAVFAIAGQADYPFGPVLVAKVAYGAILGGIAANLAVRRLLRQPAA